MIELARQYEQGCVSLSCIAKQEHISQKYLERLFANFKKAKLVKAAKGASGGYELAKDPDKIRIFDIVKTMEGPMSPFYCLTENGKVHCQESCSCGATKVLLKVQAAVNKTLQETMLGELI
jgi:Rrf2 family protein